MNIYQKMLSEIKLSSDSSLLLEEPPAWHGTPHDVDEFTVNKIGTGEGAQAFGWGMYFSSRKSVAKWYRDKLVKMQAKLYIDGKEYKGGAEFYDLNDVDRLIADAWHKMGVGYKTKQQLILHLKNGMKMAFKEWKDRYKQAIEKAKSDSVEVANDKGNLYRVEIIPKDDKFLDWDKALDEQSDYVKNTLKGNSSWEYAIKNLKGKSGDNGRFVYMDIQDNLGSPEKASKYLLSLGIAGIRYIGTSSNEKNYVVFDDADVKIIHKESKTNIFQSMLSEIKLSGDMITTNSLGQPIHSTKEGIKNFWEWFGDSKVVDEQGRPLVCYHGSHHPNITTFDATKAGSIQTSDWGEGIYFSLSKRSGDYYRKEALKATNTTLNKLYDEYEEAAKKMGTTPMDAYIDLGGYNSEKYKELAIYKDRYMEELDSINSNSDDGKVYTAYLKITKPYHYSYQGMTDPYMSRYAKEKECDGIIIGDYEEILVFDSSQIKTIDNNGNFNPHSKNISESVITDNDILLSEFSLSQFGDFDDLDDDDFYDINPALVTLFESNKVHDERNNRTPDRFLAGTRTSHLYLRDLSTKYPEYRFDFENQMIVNVKDKVLEFPKKDIGSGNIKRLNRDVYTADRWYAYKLYKDLIRHGIIDGTYKIRHDIEASYNTPELVLYHGTSSSVVDNIKKIGLTPIDTETLDKKYRSTYRGNNSTILNHTENYIYLTVNKELAEIYAENQAKERNDTPILITVTIPDKTKIVVDDDYIRKQLNPIQSKVYWKFSDEEKKEFKKLKENNTFVSLAVTQNQKDIKEISTKFSNPELILNMISELKEQYDKLLSTNYVKSLISQHQAVAYRGRIPAKFLSFEEIEIREPIVKESKFKNFVRKADALNDESTELISKLNSLSTKIKCNVKGSCMVFTELAAKYLVENNILNCYIIEGYVTFENSDHTFQHSWILHNNTIIDPTLIQFHGWDLGTVKYKIKKKYTPVQYLKLSNKYPTNLSKYISEESTMNVYQKMLSEIRLTELDEYGQEDILQNDSIETTGGAFTKDTQEELPMEPEEEECEVEPKGKVRLLTIDRKNINKELKELLKDPKSIFPLTQIKTIINKYDIKPIDDDGSEIEIKLKGTDGDLDFTLASKDDRIISNSALIVYWHKNNDGTYNFNVYCS